MSRTLAKRVTAIEFRCRKPENLVGFLPTKRREASEEQVFRIRTVRKRLPFRYLVLHPEAGRLGRKVHDGIGVRQIQRPTGKLLLVSRRPYAGPASRRHDDLFPGMLLPCINERLKLAGVNVLQRIQTGNAVNRVIRAGLRDIEHPRQRQN